MILNHHQIDNLAFKYSIYGGNIDQKLPEKKNKFKELIMLTIIMLRDDLFDWLFEQKFAADIEKSDKNKINTDILYDFIMKSIKDRFSLLCFLDIKKLSYEKLIDFCNVYSSE